MVPHKINDFFISCLINLFILLKSDKKWQKKSNLTDTYLYEKGILFYLPVNSYQTVGPL